MLSKSFKKLTTSVQRMQENLDLREGNPGRGKRSPSCLCERAKRLGLGFVESGGLFEYQKPQNLGFKTSFAQKPIECTDTH